MEPENAKFDLSTILPKRVKGKHTENFRTVQVTTNFFEVRLMENFDQLFIFSIRFEPMIQRDNRAKRKQIIKGIWDQIKSFIKNPAIGGMNLYSNVSPSQDCRQMDYQGYKIAIKKVKVLETKTNPGSLLFFLNNKFRNVMAQTGYSQIGRSGKYFNVKHKRQIDNLNMYSGFKANFMILEKGIFLRVDSAKKIVRSETVLQYINQIYKKNEGKDRDDKRNIVRNSLLNLTVQVNYGNGRYYIIEDVLYKQINQYQFHDSRQGLKKIDKNSMEQGKQNTTTLTEYYKNKYNLTITKPKQPLLKIQSKKGGDQMVLLPEFCLMTGIPDDFDEFKRKKISQQTILDARTKSKQIMGVMDQIKKTQDFQNLNQIGIQLSRRMYQMNAKMMPIPQITLGDGKKVMQGKQAFFNLFSDPIYASKHKVKLAILYFRADIRDMIKTFQNTSRNLKVQFEFEKYQIRDERRAIQQISSILKSCAKNGFNISLIVIPNHMKTQYKRIKEASLIDNKMVCQIFTDGKLRNKNAQSIATKVLLQIIAKRGNTLWVPKNKAQIDQTMIVGVDNTLLKGNRHVLAVCGTVNSTLTSVYSKNIEYEGVQGKFEAMSKAMLDIVNYYVDRNKVPPREIVLFMNSIAGDQIKILRQLFVNEFIKRCEETYRDKAPALQVVLINTKTSERFFTNNGQNVRAGTLINSDIVSKEYDWYLVSQNSNRGCIVPNHYKVAFSNSKMEQGNLQQICFGQCFNYVNWSGSIKVPGILQYAKKCAKFNSEVMQDSKVTESLERCLYFV